MKDLFIKRFKYYKDLGDKTFQQLTDKEVLWKYNEESNSISTIVKHLSGNMKSRWTNFIAEDGEKSWRKRDSEFQEDIQSKEEMLKIWEEGWQILFNALDQITPENIHQTLLIRGESLYLFDALLRQLAHYSYHIGQIIFVAKMLKNENWKTLSIAKNKSGEYHLELLKNLISVEIPENASPVCLAKSDEVRDEFKID